jgi:hypothetical protein
VIEDFVTEYHRYRTIGERALEQIGDDALNHITAPDGNSAAMIVRHVGGNFVSRFTDFLTTDGEKPWRDRESEFETRHYSRGEMMSFWEGGWKVLETQLASLTDTDMSRTVTIRGQPLTVHAALSRSLSHVAYHVGQLVLLARTSAEAPWRWISIPKGATAAYNAKPDLEKAPR